MADATDARGSDVVGLRSIADPLKEISRPVCDHTQRLRFAGVDETGDDHRLILVGVSLPGYEVAGFQGDRIHDIALLAEEGLFDNSDVAAEQRPLNLRPSIVTDAKYASE